MMLELIVSLSMICAPEPAPIRLPAWIQALNPAAEFRLRWDERLESGQKASGPQLRVRTGLFPKFSNSIDGGLEISTGASSIGSSPDTVQFSDGMSSKSVVLSQAFLKFNRGTKPNWKMRLGKFQSPIFYSPLLWDEDVRPEGLLQTLSWNNTKWIMTIYAAQFSVDQATASLINATPIRRSWLFQQGAEGEIELDGNITLKLGINFYYFFDPSERLADASGPLGNSFVGTIGISPSFLREFAPLEVIGQLTNQTLGIHTGLRGAFAINFRTPDNQRSFFVEAFAGNDWKRDALQARISYFYNEPDTTIALFSDNEYGHTNRKGPRIQLMFFPLDQLRLGASYIFVETLASSPFQSRRHEVFADVEMKF